MSKVGKYRGVEWRYVPERAVLPHCGRRGRRYFPLGNDGEPTGDSFATLATMQTWIDDPAQMWIRVANLPNN